MISRHSLPLLAPFFASGLLASFFLPWFVIFGEPASGYALGRLGEFLNVVWVVPGLSIATIAASWARPWQRWLSVATGLSPFALICWAFWRVFHAGGSQGVVQAWAIARRTASPGLYLTLLCGAALMVVALFETRLPKG